MSKKELHRALSSDTRVETLKLLYRKPHDIEEIAKKLKLQPVTVRHHIQALQEAGLLESYEERTGLAGRPKTFYKLARTLPDVAFPARRYLDFSKSLIDVLLRTIGKDKTQEILAEAGREMGEQTMKYIESQNKIVKWTPREFAEILVEKYFRESGAEPELVEVSDSKVVYRLHNCLLRELSKEMPDLMCEVLHHEFHQAILESMKNDIKGVQTTCMGHGDINCEHVVEWASRKKSEKTEKVVQ